MPVPCSCKDALQQNEVTNIFEDDFAALGDEEASSGSRRENSITEYQSFVDLTFSKNKVVSAIQWLPHRKVSRQPGSWCASMKMGSCLVWSFRGRCPVNASLLPVQLVLQLQAGCGLTRGHHLSSLGK